MPAPKRQEKKSSKSKGPAGEDSWRSEIESLTLSDDRWTCVIAMIVETRVDHGRYVDLFNDATTDETRAAIFSLSYDKLIRGVKLLAKSDLRQSPTGQGICRFASKEMEATGEAALSPWLLSRLIKFFVHRAKLRHQAMLEGRKRAEAEIAREMEALKSTTSASRPNTVGKAKGGSGDAKPFVKTNTRLRKRGEEVREKLYIDDAPVDGPDLYVVLSGFHEPALLTELLDAGLPLVAVFKVCRSGEELEVVQPNPDEANSYLTRVEETKARLQRFWTTLEAPLNAGAYYGQVIWQTFCPPELPEYIPEEEIKPFETDAYRRISFLMYDLCDILRYHASYIRSMRLQTGLEETRSVVQDRGNYDAVLGLFSEEDVSVPMVLDALLNQVAKSASAQGTENDWLKTREKIVQEDTGQRESKIDYLNQEFDVIRNETNPPRSPNPRLIIHGDALASKTHRCSVRLDDVPGTNGMDLGKGVLIQFAIASLWRGFPPLTSDQVDMYAYHIKQISGCFAESVNSDTMKHYLHLLRFEKLINGGRPRINFHKRADLETRVSFPTLKGLCPRLKDKRTKSETAASRQNSVGNFGSSFSSDSKIEYNKSIEETFECPEFFDLIDTREMLTSGHFSSLESCPEQNPGGLNFAEFDSVQPLSPEVFSQLFFECCEEYDVLETRYFAPTDSMLIFFHSTRSCSGVTQQQYTASIRTPVCLRDFSRFIIDEEKDWIEKEDAAHAERLTAEEAQRETRISKSDKLPMSSCYTDGDFILEDSIKGAETRKQKSRLTLMDVMEPVELPVEDERTTRPRKETKGTVARGDKKLKGRGGPINPKNKADEGVGTNALFLPLKRVTSLRCARDCEPWIFLGYDVGNHRVQVSGSESKFLSNDGTMVKVCLEEWAYADSTMQITIELHGNNLVLYNFSGDQVSPIFHFTTANGIVMSFALEEKSDPIFRASWPSGLIVEVLPGDGPLGPFYVKQSYVSKGPGCSGILDENYRVFLRDGGIIVFHNDDSVRLLRSSGTVTSCSGFSTQRKDSGDSVSEDDAFDRTKNSENVKIRRIVVLEPDGRRYEIYDGEMIRELEGELVRTASDYEVNEKFTRRSDGTNTLINSEGVLTVCFPDGSRITTGPIIAEEPVYCVWTDEELDRFNPINDDETSTEFESLGESLSRENIPTSDEFVSIFLSSCMEHENYATVTYDQSKLECTLSMPGSVQVRVSTDAGISITVGGSVSLQVKRNEIVFTGRSEAPPGGSSSSVYNLEYFSASRIPGEHLLRTTDSYGNVFSVDAQGRTSYTKYGEQSNRVKTPEQGQEREEEGEEKDDEEEEEEECSSSSRIPTPTCNPSKLSPKSCRLFVVGRDLRGHEYLRRSDRLAQENEADLAETTSVFYLQVPDQLGQRLCTTLTAVDPIKTSQAWLQSYQVPSIRPTNADRRDLLRSTYSLPWNYLFPYGRNGRGIREHTWNRPLKNSPAPSQPEVLLGRTTQTIKNGEENVLGKLRAALGCYWSKAINQFGEYRVAGLASRVSVATLEEREIENWLSNFALGGRKTFDRELYLSGLVKNRQSAGVVIQRRVPDRRKNFTEEEIEWYKSCLTDQTVPPYFSNVPGACYQWIMKCVDEICGGEIKDGTEAGREEGGRMGAGKEEEEAEVK
ncbi:uncharacterized protein LOC124175616 [Neodiprion fabricii]|uniref:uncharacterized protein LOC124175616 n=1 Tax=Neodiprion fabricii TaxID=2872261 RepID=UPI001ED8F000|nr:uncharacterized protein LOC124175616 [Neodiprion fabricii]